MTSQLATILSGAFSILVVIFSIWAFVLKNNEEKISQIEFEQKLTQKTDKIEELNGKIIDLQGEGIEALKHQTNMLTGGNSYPILLLSHSQTETTYLWHASLFVSGKYSLKDFSYVISITQNKKTKKFPSKKTNLRQMTLHSLGDIIDLRTDANSKINIRFFAQNGTWHQKIEFRKSEKGEYQFKSTLLADDLNKGIIINESKFGEGTKLGNFTDLDSIRYKNN